MFKKEERRASNLSVEFLCSTLDLLMPLKMLRDQSSYIYLQESVASKSPSPPRERLAKTSPLWYKKL